MAISKKKDILVRRVASEERLLCSFCMGNRLIRKGISKSKNFAKQKYFCSNCNKHTVNPVIVNNTW